MDGDALCDKALPCMECLHQTCIQKLEPKLLNGWQIWIGRRAANADGRKDFWKKIVEGMLRVKGKLEDRYATSPKFSKYFQIRIKLFVCN